MEFELEINKILNTIKVRDIKTYEDMNKNIETILSLVYTDYLKYTINIDNYSIAQKKLLNNYEYIDTIEDLTPGDCLISIDLSRFYNMKVSNIGFFVKCVNDKTIRTINFKRFFNYSCNNRLFFRKLNNSDKVKIMLIETIGEL